MAAIARDGNNQMFPLAIAVVESECKESWGWFLNLLVSAFGNNDITTCTFISDRQKGLVESFNTILPHTEHRFCVRHLYANFKLRFKDKILKDLMWSAARAYLENGYNEKMDEIKAISKEAYEWLKNISPQLWCKHMMSGRSKCDLLCNNLCESFNNYIKEARDMPILTMLEALRRQFMCRIHTKRLLVEKCSGKLCPRIQDKVNMIKDKALDFECHVSANGKWEVTMGNKGWDVDLNRQTCSCKEWELTGIPCMHATCAILMEHKEPEDFVSRYYSLDMYKRAYSFTINRVPDHSQWVTDASNEQPIMPPPFKKQPGRPKKLRKKGPDEISVGGKLTRNGITQTCSNCGDTTHNKRRCKKPPPPVNNQKTRKRKATKNLEGSAPSTQASTQAPMVAARSKGEKSRRLGYGNWNGVGLMQNGLKPPQHNTFSLPQQNSHKHDATTSTSVRNDARAKKSMRGSHSNTSGKDGDIQVHD
ncbi:PREDICTED: uncharacterized protein LOC105971112 [Erythranthe guttata]|uniref:uncharacterized protein LOC105971112 n=1 Tax=Erythranthe guttata TaxID=4155 RepID=UPI00064DAE72|nr:PREDICTED: uncharacterized protein LOC105971112 [Erythranthe guttata]|eukprot:XP_012851412.1 PREDICTED: uncharacterized protein LOC105971112 [Erythranthe guttata]